MIWIDFQGGFLPEENIFAIDQWCSGILFTRYLSYLTIDHSKKINFFFGPICYVHFFAGFIFWRNCPPLHEFLHPASWEHKRWRQFHCEEKKMSSDLDKDKKQLPCWWSIPGSTIGQIFNDFSFFNNKNSVVLFPLYIHPEKKISITAIRLERQGHGA